MDSMQLVFFLMTFGLGWSVGFVTGMHVPWSVRNARKRRDG